MQRICRELSVKPFIVATGGYAEFLASESETIEEVNNNLTLEGLKIIYNRQKEKDFTAKL